MANSKQEGALSYSLKIGSKTLKGESNVTSIVVNIDAQKVPSASISLVDGSPADADFTLSGSSDYDIGKEVTISLGYKEVVKQVFKGVIVKHSLRIKNNSSLLQLECKHKAHELTVGRSTRSFDDKADDAIIKDILKERGLTSEFKLSGSFIKVKQQVQFDSTDWDYILTRAELNSKVVCYDGKTVMIQDPSISGGAKDVFNYGINVFSFESEFDSRSQLNEVNGRTWDKSKLTSLESKGAASSFKQLENPGVKHQELKKVSSPKSFEYVHGGELIKAELDALTKSQNVFSSLAKSRGTIKILGTAELKVSDVVELKGFGKKFTGKVMITGLRQEFSSLGWFTWIQFGISAKRFTEQNDVHGQAASGVVPGIQGLQIGVVEKIDGDDEHRVQVLLPVAGKKIKLWARMGFPHAGKKRGIIFWPEKGDEVIVGFLHDDPRFPIILGSLLSKKNQPEIKPIAANNEKGIFSKAQLKILMDDKDKTIHLETPGGHKVSLDDKAKEIKLKDSHGNTIEMSKSGITISSKGEVKISATKKVSISSKTSDVSVEGVNIQAKAKAKFAASGNGGAELKSSALAVVKGSIVQIN